MVRLTDRPDMTLDVYRGRKTTMQHQQQKNLLYVIFHNLETQNAGLVDVKKDLK